MIVQLRFRKEVALTLVPMVWEQPGPRKKNACWKSQLVDNSVATSTEESGSGDSGSVHAIAANEELLPISFKPCGAIQYQNPKLSSVRSDILYVSRASNQGAFDSFIVYNEVLYIFQITIANSLPIKGGLTDFFHRIRSKRYWKGKSGVLSSLSPRGTRWSAPNQAMSG